MNDTNSTAKSLTSAYGVFAIMLAIGGKYFYVLIVSTKLNVKTKKFYLNTKLP